MLMGGRSGAVIHERLPVREIVLASPCARCRTDFDRSIIRFAGYHNGNGEGGLNAVSQRGRNMAFISRAIASRHLDMCRMTCKGSPVLNWRAK
jgi:hypothetical protein